MYERLGIFDSRVGGLTVLRALIKHRVAQSYVYFGDTARVPYGTKSPTVVTEYARENATLLLEEGVDALVVACNTASAYALSLLQDELTVPVFGVIHAAVEETVQRAQRHVAVLATEGTVRSGVYQSALQERAPALRVRMQACPLFVPLIEENMLEDPVTELIARRYLAPLTEAGVDSVLLGCTHYPLLRPLLAKVLGPNVQLIDSAAPLAKRLGRQELSQGHDCRFIVSDDPEKFAELGGRFSGRSD